MNMAGVWIWFLGVAAGVAVILAICIAVYMTVFG